VDSLNFRFERQDGEMSSWTPNQADIERWKGKFPGMDVARQLESLAAWTQKNENVKRKRRKRKNAIGWITKMLEREHQKSEGYSAISRARDALAEPIWKQRGFASEQEWDRRQAEIHQESLQGALSLHKQPMTSTAKAAFASIREELGAVPYEPLKSYEPSDQINCNHKFKRRTHSEPMCDCGMFLHQWEISHD
jgi:hypothetical protein